MTPSPKGWLLAGAMVISFSPVMVKIAADSQLGPTAIAFWRTGLGAGFLLILALGRRRGLWLSVGAFGYAALAGVFFFVDLTCWHRSIIYVGTGMATILGNTQVFVTALLSWFIFKERLSLMFILSVIAAFGGLVLLVGAGSDQVEFTSEYVTGVALGLATGVAYSAYIICLKKGTTQAVPTDLVTFMAVASLFSTVGLVIGANLFGEVLIPPDLKALLAVGGLGLVVHCLAWLAITGALPKVKTAQAGLILLLQPILSAVWGVLFFGERLTGLQVLGAAITLVAMYLGSLQKR